MSGRLVDRVLDEVKGPGRFDTTWRPAKVGSGLYYLRLRAAGEARVTLLIIIK